MTCFFSKHDANINKNFGLFSIYIKKSYFFINIHRNKETNCTVASFFLLLIQIFYSCFRSKGIVNWKKNNIFADELKQGMMKRTTINVLLRVVLVTTMTFVMSIQTAGAQTKDPIDEAFMADVEKASLQNEDVRKGGSIFGMAPKGAIPLFEKAINSSDPTVRRVAIINAALCYDTLKDYQKAMQLLLKLAQQGDAYAQKLLGMFYSKQKDYQKAVQWYTKAARQRCAQGLSEGSAVVHQGSRARGCRCTEQSSSLLLSW